MIEEHLVNFTIIIGIQLLFFIAHAAIVKKQNNIGKYLFLGVLVGLPFGIAFDFLVGMNISIFSYAIGFPIWFLVINGLFSYGFMIASVFLLQNHSIVNVLAWSFALGLVYELTNYFFPVWEWTFSSIWFEYMVVIGAAYFGLAWLMMCVLQIVFGTQFRIVPFSFSLKKPS